MSNVFAMARYQTLHALLQQLKRHMAMAEELDNQRKDLQQDKQIDSASRQKRVDWLIARSSHRESIAHLAQLVKTIASAYDNDGSVKVSTCGSGREEAGSPVIATLEAAQRRSVLALVHQLSNLGQPERGTSVACYDGVSRLVMDALLRLATAMGTEMVEELVADLGRAVEVK